MHLPANAYWEAMDNAFSSWAPATRMEDPDGISGSWLLPDPALLLHLGSKSMDEKSLCL